MLPNILIQSLAQAATTIQGHLGHWHVVSIRDSEYRGRPFPLDGLAECCRSLYRMYFDDVTHDLGADLGVIPPRRQDIADVLAWAQGKDDLLVHCLAGVSRSAAVGYLIACQHVPPDEAVARYLDPRRHYPNALIVQLGAKILKNPAIWDVYAQQFGAID